MRNQRSALLCIQICLCGIDWITQSGDHLSARAETHSGSTATSAVMTGEDCRDYCVEHAPSHLCMDDR